VEDNRIQDTCCQLRDGELYQNTGYMLPAWGQWRISEYWIHAASGGIVDDIRIQIHAARWRTVEDIRKYRIHAAS
jgi:hypothetical protein